MRTKPFLIPILFTPEILAQYHMLNFPTTGNRAEPVPPWIKEHQFPTAEHDRMPQQPIEEVGKALFFEHTCLGLNEPMEGASGKELEKGNYGLEV